MRSSLRQNSSHSPSSAAAAAGRLALVAGAGFAAGSDGTRFEGAGALVTAAAGLTVGEGAATLPTDARRLAGIPELTGSWAYASLDGIFDLAAKMDLPVELGGSKSDSWTSEVPFEFIDLNP